MYHNFHLCVRSSLISEVLHVTPGHVSALPASLSPCRVWGLLDIWAVVSACCKMLKPVNICFSFLAGILVRNSLN